MNHAFLGTVAAISLAVAATLYADGPASSDKQVADILELATRAGYDSVTEVSFDDGIWEVEAMKGPSAVELHFDPKSGKLLNERADGPHPQLPRDGKSLAEIVTGLQQSGYGQIEKVELETTGWQVEALRGVQWRELTVNAKGEVVADHPED